MDKEIIQLKLNIIKTLASKIADSKLASCDIYNNEKGSIISTITFIDEKGNELIITGRNLDY